jgi:hypothetical protein
MGEDVLCLAVGQESTGIQCRSYRTSMGRYRTCPGQKLGPLSVSGRQSGVYLCRPPQFARGHVRDAQGSRRARFSSKKSARAWGTLRIVAAQAKRSGESEENLSVRLHSPGRQLAVRSFALARLHALRARGPACAGPAPSQKLIRGEGRLPRDAAFGNTVVFQLKWHSGEVR